MIKLEAIKKLRDLAVRLKRCRFVSSQSIDKELEEFDEQLSQFENELANEINNYMANNFKRNLANKRRIEHESSKVSGELLGRWNYNSGRN